MKSSRKKAAAGTDPAAPRWHALEVEVPETSRLAMVAGGMAGRPAPQANRLIESIAAACRTPGSVAADCEPTWLVAPSRRVGNAWIETLSRTGRPTANLHVTTMSALAYDIVSESLVRAALELAPPRAKLVAIEHVLLESGDELRSFVGTGSVHRLAERILHSLESLRNAGLPPQQVARGLRHSAKGSDLARLLSRYEEKLRQMRLVDRAGEVSLATEHVRAGKLPAAMKRLLVPDDLDLPRLEAELLDALQAAPGITVEILATDPPLADAPTAFGADRLRIFRAAGEANEVRFVLRTCLRLGLRLDEVEIVHTDTDTYPSVVREIVAALPRAAGDAAAPAGEDVLPVTFAEGLPLVDSKPGRALASWLAWRRDGHPQSGLERMLRDGLVEPRRLVTDAPRTASLVRELRSVRIGRGLDRSATLLAAAAARLRERPVGSFLRGGRDEDDPPEDAAAVGEEQLLARKERHRQQLAALQAIVTRLVECEGGSEQSADSVLRGARLFIDSLCPADSEFDGNARRVLLDEIDAMLHWQGAHADVSPRDILDWLERLPAELVVLGSGPRPGCLHVSGLAGGGHSGRPVTFVLGLDENRFPGAAATDPVLTDGDRAQLNAAQPDARLAVAHDAVARNTALWRRLLARLRGDVWLGYSCRDAVEDAEVFPSPALLALHAEATGNPLATVDGLVRTLPPPETFVPADPELALDETQWWLATIGPHATAGRVDAAIAAHRDHLAHGVAAVAARRGDAFTPHDGHVPAAGPLLDPRADHGRAASPASLETLGSCPRRFFFRYGLGVEPVEEFDDDTDRWLNPLDAGSLLHTVLERFMRRVIDRRELPRVEHHLDELLAILDEELEESRRRHPPLTETAFAARRDELRLAMRTFLHDEERSCAETGLRPIAIEAAIGTESVAEGTPFDCPEPVAVPLAHGETIRLRGRIDRIDVRDGGGATAYSLWDYKSGSGFGFPASGARDPFDKGRKLQHGLYVVMLRARLADPSCAAAGGEVERFGYFFPTRAGKGRRLTWTSEQLADCTALVRQLAEIARHGVFLPTSDPDDCTHCQFAAVCGDPARVTRDAARMLSASAVLTQLFDTLRGDRRPPSIPDVRQPLPRSLALTPHPAAPDTPPDEPVRRRIREDLGTTLLVEAAAGTGKTTCMVDRMLALVRTGAARPEGIVAVTFTKKAAGELRRRFREKLQQAAAAAAGAERTRLAAAVERIDSMVIGTIHSFAGRLLRERPIEAGVDPGFRELDEAGDRLLRRQAWREFVTAAPTDHAELVAMLDAVGLRLGDLSRLFIERFATYGDVESWPAEDAPPPDAAILLRELERFVERIEAQELPPAAERGTDELMSALEHFARMFRRADLTSITAVMDLAQELDRSPKVTQGSWPGTGGTDAEVKASRKATALRWQASWEDLRERVVAPALWQWRAHRYPTVVAALRTALGVYDRLRAARGVLSFQDLLCKAAILLAGNAEVRRGFRDRYTHILVDEFQDTDPVQAQMLLLLSATDPEETDWRRCRPVDGSLFVVGDPKQSLYRFRRADIVTYSAVRTIIASHGAILALTTNFRSRGDLVAWTNDTFTREFPPEATLESPSFTASTSGRREAAATAGTNSAWLAGIRGLRFVRSGQGGDAWAEAEARRIAAFIRGAIDSGMAVPRTVDEAAAGIGPRCRPGDFLIVARERRHLGAYAAALHAAGLPVDVTGTLGEDQAEPLQELRTCLAAIADPDDPVAALALLRGAVFGFSDADLHAYATAAGRFGGGIDVPESLDAAMKERLTAAQVAFRRWRHWMRHLPVAAAVERLVDDAGLMLIAASADGEAGPRGRAIAGLLQKYVERLRADRMQVVSVHECLDLLDDMIDTATRAEFDPLSIDVPSTDRVRIMNLHKAKGLEAPVVFLADYQARVAGERPEDGPFLHIDRSHERTEGWLAVTTPHGRAQRIIAAPSGWPALCDRERAFERAEQIRLDYVAATRAGTCLVVSLFEKHEPATRSRGESFTADGAWARFAPYLADAPDLPEPIVGAGRPSGSSAPPAAGIDLPDRLRQRIDAIAQPSFARISPRELLTEPAEGIRFTGDGLGEPWGRAIHRLLELAAHDPGLDLAAAAAVVLSNEELPPAHIPRAVATIESVMRSDVWKRAQAGSPRHVEVPFSVQVRGEDLPDRVRRLTGRDGTPAPTIIRGVIDLVFREPAGGRWAVIDWKTDAIAAASAPLLESHYRPQVELYAECWGLLASHRSQGEPR